MARRRRSVVLILSTDDFERLEQSARAHGHDPYLHAHWVLAERLGLSMPIVPSQGAAVEPRTLATKSAARG